MIRRAEELGLADPDLKDKPYDKSKKYQGYKRFIRGRTHRKADGGRVGFQGGGWADDLTGQGLSIYNSMISGGHSDETIQNTLRDLGYWGGDATVDTGLQSIVNTQPAIIGDGSKSYISATPQFNQVGLAGLKEYGPGGVYERNPASLGFQFDDSGAVIRPQERDWITSTASIPGQDFTKSDILNLYENFNTLSGRKSAYEDARVEGTMTKPLSWLLSTGLGAAKKIPGVTPALDYLSSKFPSSGATGTSDRTRWGVDDVGYGTGTGRDQFGVYTGGKTLLGKTADYQERMQNEIFKIANSFGLSEEDLMSLDEKALMDLKNRSGFNYRKVVDYVNKINVKAFDKIVSDRIEQEKQEAQTIKDRLAGGESYSDIGRDLYTGPGQAFEQKPSGTFSYTDPDTGESKTGYSGGRKDGGLATMFERRR